MRVRSMAAAALVAAALALSACGAGGSGGGSSPTPPPSPSPSGNFNSTFAALSGQFAHGSQVIGGALITAKAMTDAQLETAFKTLASKWQIVLSKLETLTPPAAVQQEFNTLKDAATRVEADLNAIASAAQNHDASAAKQASTTLVNDIQAAKSAAQSIDQKLGTS
jgi:hypothetical protein